LKKNPSHKRAGGVAQAVGSEFKPQNLSTTKNEKKKKKENESGSCASK
jgi:hypothetical protein